MLIYLTMIEAEEDRHRFLSLYRRYKKLMLYIAHDILHDPHDAEDAVHQSFVKLAEQVERLPDGPGQRMRNLAVTVAERKAIDLWRRRQRHPQVDLDEVPLSYSQPLPSDGTLADAMANLPPRYREVLLLKYYNGYSNGEIAAFLSATPEAVAQVLHRARARLAEMLEKGGGCP